MSCLLTSSRPCYISIRDNFDNGVTATHTPENCLFQIVCLVMLVGRCSILIAMPVSFRLCAMRRRKEIIYIPVKTPIPIAITAGRKFRLIVRVLLNSLVLCSSTGLAIGVDEVEVNHQSSAPSRLPTFPTRTDHQSDNIPFNSTLFDKLSFLRRICLVFVSEFFAFYIRPCSLRSTSLPLRITK